MANVVGGRQSKLVQLIEERQSKLSTGARKETNRMLKYSRDSLSMCALKPRAPKETAKISINSEGDSHDQHEFQKETVTISTNAKGDSHDQHEFQWRQSRSGRIPKESQVCELSIYSYSNFTA